MRSSTEKTVVYYTRQGNNVTGPHSPAEISRLASTGQLAPSDLLLSTSDPVPIEVASEAPGWVKAGVYGTLRFSATGDSKPAAPHSSPVVKPKYLSSQSQNVQRVVLTGIDIPLWDLIKLTIEWLVAAICAILIVFSPPLILLLIVLIYRLIGE